MKKRIELYDTTLRDGSQAEGISFSLHDKLKLAKRLADIGFDYVEGGYPASNEKDALFFTRFAEMQNAENLPKSMRKMSLAAFGMTRRKGVAVENDEGLASLLQSGAPVITIVGKTSAFQVEHVLKTTLDENLAMISETISYLKRQNVRVFFDAEHFFDGWKQNPDYSLKTLQTAMEAGAESVSLCDTNGGSMPWEIAAGVRAAVELAEKVYAAQTERCINSPETLFESVDKEITVKENVDKENADKENADNAIAGNEYKKTVIGIHAHNDCGLAVANSLAAVNAGAALVQGTVNGFGERCGNADLIVVAANLALKMKNCPGFCCPNNNLVENNQFENNSIENNLLENNSVENQTDIQNPIQEKATFGQKTKKSQTVGSEKSVELEQTVEFDLLRDGAIKELTEFSHFVYEMVNISASLHQPFVGRSAFAHKGGMHVSGISRDTSAYEHIPPETVGNARRVLVSELSGRSNILARTAKFNLNPNDTQLLESILAEVVKKENEGYQYEAADGSFALLVRKIAGQYKPHFEKLNYHVNVESVTDNMLSNALSTAIVKLRVGDMIRHEVSEGDGPVNAMDLAMRKALYPIFPDLREMKLVDYKVRVINSEAATAAHVRVFIESKDADEVWGTVGVDENVIEASWIALVDSIEYKLDKIYSRQKFE